MVPLHIAIESTINWYWIVDGLQEAGYDVHLAHTLGLVKILDKSLSRDVRRRVLLILLQSWIRARFCRTLSESYTTAGGVA